MPELPEVETVRTQLETSLVGKIIKEVFVYTDKMIKVGSEKISNIKTGTRENSLKFAGFLAGKKILSVKRRGKFLIIALGKGLNLMIHLRMSGQLIFLDKQSLGNPFVLSLAKSAIKQTLPSKHTHVEFIFSNEDKLFYNDTRQFGHIRLVSAEELNYVLEYLALGAEPLSLKQKDFNKLLLKHPKKRVKDFLLNQSVIAGIGNIYADESLFIAKISPVRKVGALDSHKAIALLSAIKKVLRKAIKFGGSSIEYFLMTNGSAGKFSEQHFVYGKAKQPCPNCGLALESKKIGSRTSTFCARCQL